MWGGPPFGTGPQQFGGHFDVRGAVGADVGRGNVGEGVRWIVGGEKTGRNNKIPKPKPHFDEASSLRRSEVSVLVPCCSGPFFLRPRSISLPLRRFSRPTSAPTAPRTSKWPPNCCGPVPKGGPPHITPPFALCILEKTVVEKKPLRGVGGRRPREEIAGNCQITRTSFLAAAVVRLGASPPRFPLVRACEFRAASLRKGLCRCLWRC